MAQKKKRRSGPAQRRAINPKVQNAGLAVLALATVGVVALATTHAGSASSSTSLPSTPPVTTPAATPTATRAPGPLLFADTFQHGGPLGSPWQVSGQVALTVKDRALQPVSPVRGFGYAMTHLTRAPGEVTVKARFQGGPGRDAVVTLITSKEADYLRDMVHFGVGMDGWFMQLRQDRGAFRQIGGGPLHLQAGVPYTWGMTFTPDGVLLDLPNGTHKTLTSPGFAALNGPYVVWEPAWHPGQARTLVTSVAARG